MISKKSGNKKGLSVIIGYLLLVSFAMILSVMVYAWMKTYTPTDSLECPEGVSIYIKEINCSLNDSNYVLDLTLENNGRFKIAGYFIHATNSSGQEIATINLYDELVSGGKKFGNSILFDSGSANIFEINDIEESIFILDEPVYSITIIPTRFNEIEGKTKYLGCNKGQTTEKITCS